VKKIVFWLLILGLLGYTGFKFGKPYYRYFALRADAQEVAKVSFEFQQRNEEDIRNMIFARAKELEIPIDKKDILVTRGENIMRIRTSWSEVVDMHGIFQKTLVFKVDTRG